MLAGRIDPTVRSFGNKEAAVLALIRRKGLHLERLPSGVYWLHGLGVDIRACALASITEADLIPVTSGSPHGY